MFFLCRFFKKFSIIAYFRFAGNVTASCKALTNTIKRLITERSTIVLNRMLDYQTPVFEQNRIKLSSIRCVSSKSQQLDVRCCSLTEPNKTIVVRLSWTGSILFDKIPQVYFLSQIPRSVNLFAPLPNPISTRFVRSLFRAVSSFQIGYWLLGVKLWCGNSFLFHSPNCNTRKKPKLQCSSFIYTHTFLFN